MVRLSVHTCECTHMEVWVRMKLILRPKDMGGGVSPGTASQSASEPCFSPQIVSLASCGIK